MSEPENQLEAARKVAARKYPHLKDADDPVKSARKLTQHLARRGFDPDICDMVTREFFGDPTVF
jgi:SOS response regulatory protein OraA/RecX